MEASTMTSENQRVAFTRQRLQRWLDGERATLWQDIPRYKAVRRKQDMTEDYEKSLRHRRCMDLCREGADSNSCKALYKPDLLDPNNVIMCMMKCATNTLNRPTNQTWILWVHPTEDWCHIAVPRTL